MSYCTKVTVEKKWGSQNFDFLNLENWGVVGHAGIISF